MKQFAHTKYTVIYNGLPVYDINKRLVFKQRVGHNVNKIKALHVTRLDIQAAIRYEKNPVVLKRYAQDLTLCEFELQKLWGFPEDAKFHRFWETPKCTCPKMDNEDNYPTGYYTINLQCPLHGSVSK